MPHRARLKFFDIGVNLTDSQFRGIYRSKRRHEDDFHQIWERSQSVGCDRWLITGGDIQDSIAARELAGRNDSWSSTAGIHPTRANEYTPDSQQQLRSLISSRGIAAYGEFGLDYDRLNYASKESQEIALAAQIPIAKESGLPLFLHSRGEEASHDLINALKGHTWTGVVHSFTSTLEEAQIFIDMGFYIGINGCSMKSEANIEVIKALPVDKLMFETDAPWCEIRPSHASWKYLSDFNTWFEDRYGFTYPESRKLERFEFGKCVKSRNEPCAIIQVAYCVSKIKEVDIDELCDIVYASTMSLFK